METYFNESVQGLDIGSKMKYRGVVIGEVTRISFTYVKYEQDKPMTQRKRYVMVEAQLEPRLVGGRAANDIASPEIDEGRSRARPARASRAAGDHRHQLPRARLRRFAAGRRAADRLGARQHLHPEHAVHGDDVRQRGIGNRRSPASTRHRDDARESEQAADDAQRIALRASTRRESRRTFPALPSAPTARWRRSSRRSTPSQRRSCPTRPSDCWPSCARPTPS